MNGADLSLNRSNTSPVVDFTSQDFESIQQDLITYAQAKYADRWTNFNDAQFGVIIADLVAYLGDLLTYQLNSTIREAFITSVIRRQNLQNLAKAYQYELVGELASTVTLRCTLDPAGVYPFTLGRDHQFSNGGSGDSEVIFQPSVSTGVLVYPGVGYVDVECFEGELFEDVVIGVSTSAPSQRWQVPQQRIIRDSISISVGGGLWERTTNFSIEASTAAKFKVVQTDLGDTFIVFGDGKFGAIPALNAEIHATYRVGGGRRGNLPADSIKTRVTTHPNILSVNNLDRSSGGDAEQTMRAAKDAIPASLSTLERAVSLSDHEKMVINLVPSVVKARAAAGLPAGSRNIKLYVAPAGGGQPTAALKNQVATTFSDRKMVTNRVRAFSPVYRQCAATVLLHVNNNFRAEDVRQVAREGLLNSQDSGLLNFSQMDFGGVSLDAGGNPTLLICSTRLQTFFRGLKDRGLDRAEILELTVSPLARARESGNTGNGVFQNITTTTARRRRRYEVIFQSATQYRVYERLVGRVTSLTEYTLRDETKFFGNEGISSFAGYKLTPQDGVSTELVVASATDQTITTVTGSNLFTLTAPGSQYLLTPPALPPLVTLGATYTAPSSIVSFSIVAGSSPFFAGDGFILDIYPAVGDIELLSDEYPEFTDTSLTLRTSGGARV